MTFSFSVEREKENNYFPPGTTAKGFDRAAIIDRVKTTPGTAT